MSKTGRPRNFLPCPDCRQPIKSSHSPYFKCGCRGYIVRNGKLCPTRPRGKKAEPQQEKAEIATVGKFLTANEFERLQGPAPQRKMRNR